MEILDVLYLNSNPGSSARIRLALKSINYCKNLNY